MRTGKAKFLALQIAIDNSQGSQPQKDDILPSLHNLQSAKSWAIMQLDLDVQTPEVPEK